MPEPAYAKTIIDPRRTMLRFWHEVTAKGERIELAAGAWGRHRALARVGLSPLELEAKEGLALLNGTQVSTALTLTNLFAAEANLEAALIAGAMTNDAIKGGDKPFDAHPRGARPAGTDRYRDKLARADGG